jgi:methylated-DNA-[protein]-cysteine S-methyltransferase
MGVPYGARSTYGQIAEDIGSPRAVRAVGNANRANPINIIVPCHRVIGSDGGLVGYGGGLPLKKWLLRLEQGYTRTQRPIE